MGVYAPKWLVLRCGTKTLSTKRSQETGPEISISQQSFSQRRPLLIASTRRLWESTLLNDSFWGVGPKHCQPREVEIWKSSLKHGSILLKFIFATETPSNASTRRLWESTLLNDSIWVWDQNIVNQEVRRQGLKGQRGSLCRKIRFRNGDRF